MTIELNRRHFLGGVTGAGAVAVATSMSGNAEAASLPTIQLGSHGAAVTTLQQKLGASGFWVGSTDGSFGQQTLQSVYALQKANGLARDGVVGAKSWVAVNSGRRPGVRSAASGIEIDKKAQLLKVVSGGKAVAIINTSTAGNYSFMFEGEQIQAETPSGSFKVYETDPDNGWQTGVLGKMYRPYYFNGSIAIHGDAFNMVPVVPVSHGCCRISIPAQDMLIHSGYLKKGTSVRVY